jgi:hypothetical protein
LGVRTGYHSFFPGSQVPRRMLSTEETPGTGWKYKEEALSRRDREGDGAVCQKMT